MQRGVVHGVIELPGGPLRLEEIPAQRWRRWGDRLGPLDLPSAYAHTGIRAAFAFPDGTIADWVLTPDGWRAPTLTACARSRRSEVKTRFGTPAPPGASAAASEQRRLSRLIVSGARAGSG